MIETFLLYYQARREYSKASVQRLLIHHEIEKSRSNAAVHVPKQTTDTIKVMEFTIDHAGRSKLGVEQRSIRHFTLYDARTTKLANTPNVSKWIRGPILLDQRIDGLV